MNPPGGHINDGKVIFTPSKVDYHHRKIVAYLDGERIFPTTIELDLSQRCSRSCPGCPYSVSRAAGLSLQLPFLDRLFSILGPHTPGIVFSGGEPTIYPLFAEVVRLARAKGFKEICVISNGEDIDKPDIQDALLKYVTAIRISQYEWQEGESAHFRSTLRKIEKLRERIDAEGSALEIGASMLTRSELNHRYLSVGRMVLDAGVHWLYFHPYCVDWQERRPRQADQTGVLAAIEELEMAASPGANIQVPYARYGLGPLRFERLHGSHFLLQVGADGVVYAGPECKYEREFALLDLNEGMPEDFLWDERRTRRIEQIDSENYRFIGTKHRPPMFSDYIQKLIDSRDGGSCDVPPPDTQVEFAYPNVV
jgi:organic radical activating enzyme